MSRTTRNSTKAALPCEEASPAKKNRTAEASSEVKEKTIADCFNDLREQGFTVHGGHGDCEYIEMEVGDTVHKYLCDWAKGCGDKPCDPLVTNGWTPPAGSVNAKLADSGQILVEANSMAVHYAGLPNGAFHGGDPVIPGPVAFLPPYAVFQQAQAALVFLPSRIGNPGPLYPTIHAQSAGAYLCTMSIHFLGCIATLHIRRR